MKKGKKVIVLTLVLLLLCGCKDNKNTQNGSGNEQKEGIQKIDSQVTLNDFQFELVSANLENGVTEFVFKVKNISNETKSLKEFLAIVKDKEDKQMVTLTAVVEKEMASGEETSVACSYGGDLTNYNSFDYQIPTE